MSGITLPRYELRVGPAAQAGNAPIDQRSAGAGAAALAEGAARASNSLFQMSEARQRAAEEQATKSARIEAAKIFSQTQMDWSKRYSDATLAAPAGAPDFSATLDAEFQKDVEARLQAAPARAKDWLAERYDGLRGQYFGQAIQFEATRRVEKQLGDLSETVGLQANAVRSDFGQLHSALALSDEAIALSALSEPAKQEQGKRARQVLVESALEGLTDSVPDDALKLLNGGGFDRDLAAGAKDTLIRRAEAELTRRQREAEQRAHYARAELRDELRDVEARLADGRPARWSEGRVRALMGADADSTIQSLRDAEALGADRASVRWASPDEVQALRAGRLVSLNDPNSPNYRQNAQAMDQLDREIAARQRQLAADPAAYVGQAGTIQAAARAVEAAAPEQTQAAYDDYVRATLAEQERLGVPAPARRLLPVAQAEAVVAQLQSAAGEDRADALTAMASRYGQHWPKVFAELTAAKLPPEYRVLATIDNPVVRKEAGDALSLAQNELRGLIASADATQADKAILAELEPLQKSLGLAPDGAAIVAAYQDMARRMAYTRVRSGVEAGTAGAAAVRDIIAARYHFVEQGDVVARVPAPLADQVLAFATRTLLALNPADLADIGGNTALTPAERQAIALDAALRGVWVTSPDDQGWIRLDVRREPVLRADGSVLSVRFAEAETTSANDPMAQISSNRRTGYAQRKLSSQISAGRDLNEFLKSQGADLSELNK